jgi:outer membrane protein, multidrug efflux system
MNHSVSVWYTQHVKRLLARVIACSMLLILPSCAIPCLRDGEPGPDLPDTFNGVASPDSSAQLGIDEFFNDPKLTSLIDQALAGNRELKILDQEVQVARNEILARRGAYLPFVTVGAETGLDKPSVFTPLGTAEEELEFRPGKHFPDPLGNFMGGLNFFWAIDIWRELRNARDAAEQRYCAAIERRNYFVTQMVAEIAENYYELMALDLRLATLDRIIQLQQQSYVLAQARKKNARGTELAVQRFLAEVRKNQSEKLIVQQEIVEAENRINFRANRFPQSVERPSAGFLDLKIHALRVGLPSQLLLNRPDIRQAEHEMEAAGLDVLVARAHFYPRLDITAGVGYQAFNPRYLINPDALIYNLAGHLVAPLINRKAIRAEYLSANAKQLQSLYNYQRVILNAFTEVINRMSKAANYGRSVEIKKEQLKSLEASVAVATQLFKFPRAGVNVDYVDVLLAQRDLMDARTVLIQTKSQQLSAIVNAYQALGGGLGPRRPQAANAPVAPVPPLPAPAKKKAPAPAKKNGKQPAAQPKPAG